MSRVLTAVRVVVPPEHTAEWLATLEVLAGRLAARGQHLWVFRHERAAGVWLEFTEGKDAAAHRANGPADDAEAVLEQQLRRLAAYDDTTACDRWTEFRFGEF